MEAAFFVDLLAVQRRLKQYKTAGTEQIAIADRNDEAVSKPLVYPTSKSYMRPFGHQLTIAAAAIERHY